MNNILRIRDDFSKQQIVQKTDYKWVASPQSGVDRMMLDRIGGEVARATSIVRYASNSSFSSHVHQGGEEFLVLEGVFSDEHSDYSQWVYVRNPIGSQHTPKVGAEGAIIFVKLHQFSPDDQAQVVIDTTCLKWTEGIMKGTYFKKLHQFENEHVALMKLQKNTQIKDIQYSGGAEILVLKGTLYGDDTDYSQGAWIRYPGHLRLSLLTKDEDAIIFIKTGHLQT